MADESITRDSPLSVHETVEGDLDNEKATAHWGAVCAMSLCVFALIASEFMPVSLLTLIASDLHVTEGMAGQGIAMSGAFAVLTSLCISSIATVLNLRILLLGLTVLMGFSGLVVACAPTYAVYLVGRALIGVVVGGFWSLSAATIMRLVSSQQVPRALAILNGGNAFATVVAAPLGSYLGAEAGWRGAFACLVPLVVLAWLWQAATLPSLPPRLAPGRVRFWSLFRSRAVAWGLAAAGVFFMGQFTLFIYLRPFLESVTHVGSYTLSLLLLGMGIAGVIGTLVIGSALQYGLYRVLLLAPLSMAGIALGLMLWGEDLLAVAMLLGLWGLVATAVPVAWWSWIATTLPHDAEAGGGLMVAIIQLCIGLGSALGGYLYDAAGHLGNMGASMLMLILSAALVSFTARKTGSNR